MEFMPRELDFRLASQRIQTERSFSFHVSPQGSKQFFIFHFIFSFFNPDLSVERRHGKRRSPRDTQGIRQSSMPLEMSPACARPSSTTMGYPVQETTCGQKFLRGFEPRPGVWAETHNEKQLQNQWGPLGTAKYWIWFKTREPPSHRKEAEVDFSLVGLSCRETRATKTGPLGWFEGKPKGPPPFRLLRCPVARGTKGHPFFLVG